MEAKKKFSFFLKMRQWGPTQLKGGSKTKCISMPLELALAV